MSKVHVRAGLLALALAGLLAGCSVPAGLSGLSGGAHAPAATPSPATTRDVVAEARTRAAQYDYAGARALLARSQAPGAKAELAAVTAAEARAVVRRDDATISHIFYHSLVVDPARAFRSGSKAQGYLDYMVTEKEFRAQLEQLYARGYVLVHASDIAQPDAAGVMRYRPIALPPGKTPLVLSIDDTCYYEYMTGDGFASKLVLQPDGRVLTEYTDAHGTTTVGSHDVMPIVDDFVREHPDFSYHGHKGTMAVTGYNGVLGYRTSVRTYGDTARTRSEIAQATTVADAMKKNGWLFASHTWGHLDATRTSVTRLATDAERWDAEVRPVVGSTPQLVFAFGADIAGVERYTDANAKYRLFHDREKFDYIFPIDASRPAWMQLSGGSLRQARIDVDGISMSYALRHPARSVLPRFFDVASVWDPARPKPADLAR